MLRIFITLIYIFLLQTSCKSQSKEKSDTLKKKYNLSIDFCLTDTANLQSEFWDLNKVLAKEWYDSLANPNTAVKKTDSIFYITNLLKEAVYFHGTELKKAKAAPYYYIESKDTFLFKQVILRKDFKRYFPNDPFFVFGLSGMNDLAVANRYMGVYAILKESTLSFNGNDIEDISLNSHYLSGLPTIDITFSKKATDKLMNFTARNINKQVAILINGTVYSCPLILGAINNSRFSIVPYASADEVRAIIQNFRVL